MPCIIEDFMSESIMPLHDLYAGFYKLFTELFPKWERPSEDDLKRLLINQDCHLTVFFNDSGVIAFYITENYKLNIGECEKFTLLAYLGVKKEQQGNKIGEQMLDVLRLKFKSSPLLLEAEERQSHWYSRNGYKSFSFDYRSPSYIDNSEIPMSLMVLGSNDFLLLNNLRHMTAIVSILYLESYELEKEDTIFKEQMTRISLEYK
jgi:hypothetical protein